MLRRLRGQKGGTMVEAAIITPFLMLLTFSIVDFASMFYVYLALENGASQATRYGVTGNLATDPSNPGTTLSRADSIKLAMRNATPTITLPDSAFTFSHMAVGGNTWLAGVGGPGEIDKFTVTYTWSLLTPVLRPFFPNGEIQFSVDSAMKNEARFQ
jgi:Flp pilus assembly protein TadG